MKNSCTKLRVLRKFFVTLQAVKNRIIMESLQWLKDLFTTRPYSITICSSHCRGCVFG